VISEHTADVNGQITIRQALEPTALYRLTALVDGACVAVADFVPALVTGIDDESGGALPMKFALHQNYPNPFNPSTTISYDLPTADRIRLTICNLLGQTVAVLVDGPQSAGRYTVVWEGAGSDGEPLASGVYFCRLKTETASIVRKMLLMK